VLERIRARLTYANVVASIALFIALGGVTYAATTINSGDVVDNSLKSVDLKDGKGVKGADVVPDTLDGAAIDEDALGPNIDVTYALNAGNCAVAEGTQGSCTATCPEGTRPIAGAAYSEGNFGEQVELNASGFDTAPDPTAWQGFFDNNVDLGGADNENAVTVIATCVPVAGQTTVNVGGP
jgi:hypothetical protein